MNGIPNRVAHCTPVVVETPTIFDAAEIDILPSATSCLNRVRSRSVSYTHLDVYKRQEALIETSFQLGDVASQKIHATSAESRDLMSFRLADELSFCSSVSRKSKRRSRSAGGSG